MFRAILLKTSLILKMRIIDKPFIVRPSIVVPVCAPCQTNAKFFCRSKHGILDFPEPGEGSVALYAAVVVRIEIDGMSVPVLMDEMVAVHGLAHTFRNIAALLFDGAHSFDDHEILSREFDGPFHDGNKVRLDTFEIF